MPLQLHQVVDGMLLTISRPNSGKQNAVRSASPMNEASVRREGCQRDGI